MGLGRVARLALVLGMFVLALWSVSQISIALVRNLLYLALVLPLIYYLAWEFGMRRAQLLIRVLIIVAGIWMLYVIYSTFGPYL